MSTITWSSDLHMVVKKLKLLGLGNSESHTNNASNSSLQRNEQKAILKEFAQKTDGTARKPITSPKEYWT